MFEQRTYSWLIKADREHDDSKEFREFRRTIFHASLSRILEALREGMSKPVLLRYADGYYRKTIYGLGPYIADYPEQVLLGCVVQDWCPKYVKILSVPSLTNALVRCTALNEDLDGKIGGRRTHELTEVLMEVLDEKDLWFNYGIVSGIMVRHFTPYFYISNMTVSHSRMDSPVLIFTNYSPRIFYTK